MVPIKVRIVSKFRETEGSVHAGIPPTGVALKLFLRQIKIFVVLSFRFVATFQTKNRSCQVTEGPKKFRNADGREKKFGFFLVFKKSSGGDQSSQTVFAFLEIGDNPPRKNFHRLFDNFVTKAKVIMTAVPKKPYLDSSAVAPF